MDDEGDEKRKAPYFPPNYKTFAQLKEEWLLKKQKEKELKEEEEKKEKEKERDEQRRIQKEIEDQKKAEIEKRKKAEIERQKKSEIEKQKKVAAENQKKLEIENQKNKEVQNQTQNRGWVPPKYVTLIELKEKWLIKKEEERKMKEEEERIKEQNQNQGGGENEGKEKQSVINDEMLGRKGDEGESSKLTVGVPVGKSSDGGVEVESVLGMKSVRVRINGDSQGGKSGLVEYRVRVDRRMKADDELPNEKRKGVKGKGKWKNKRKGGDYWRPEGNEVEESLEKMGESEVLEVKHGVVEEGLNSSYVVVNRKTDGESSKAGKSNGGENGGRTDRRRDRYKRSNRGENGGRSFGGVKAEMNPVGHNVDKKYSSNVIVVDQSRGKMSENENLEVGVKQDGVEGTDRVPGDGLSDHNMELGKVMQNKSLEVDAKYGESGWFGGGNVSRKVGHSFFGGARSSNGMLWKERTVVGYRMTAGSGSKPELHEFKGNEEVGNSEKVLESGVLAVDVKLDCLVVTDNVREAVLNENNVEVGDKKKAKSLEGEVDEERDGRNNARRNWKKGGNVGRKFCHSGFRGGSSGIRRWSKDANVRGATMNSASSGSKSETHEFESNEVEGNVEQMQGGDALEVSVNLDGLKVTDTAQEKEDNVLVVGVKLNGSNVMDNVSEKGLNESSIVVENKNNSGSSKAHMAKDGEEREGRNEFRRNWNNGGNAGRNFRRSGFGGRKSGYVRVRSVANVNGSMNPAISGSKAEVHDFKGNEEENHPENVTETEVSEVGAKLDNLEVMDNVREAELDENSMVLEHKNKAESSDVDKAKHGKKREERDNEFGRNYEHRGGNVRRNFGRPAFCSQRPAFSHRNSASTRRSGALQMKRRDGPMVWVKREEKPGGANDAEAGSSGTH